jgi:hypothetical protein
MPREFMHVPIGMAAGLIGKPRWNGPAPVQLFKPARSGVRISPAAIISDQVTSRPWA